MDPDEVAVAEIEVTDSNLEQAIDMVIDILDSEPDLETSK